MTRERMCVCVCVRVCSRLPFWGLLKDWIPFRFRAAAAFEAEWEASMASLKALKRIGSWVHLNFPEACSVVFC